MLLVETVWKGRCVSHKVQQELCEKIILLENISNEMYQLYYREQVTSILYNGKDACDQVLLAGALFDNELEPSMIREIGKNIYLGEEIMLFGLEFPFYVPTFYFRSCPPGSGNRMSFVFLRCENPELNGRLVAPYTLNPQHPLNGVSHIILDNPKLDLPRCMENWMIRLLGWIKRFYITNLFYCINSDKPKNTEFNRNSINNSLTADENFRLLLDAFSDTAKEFSIRMEGFLKESTRIEKNPNEYIQGGY